MSDVAFSASVDERASAMSASDIEAQAARIDAAWAEVLDQDPAFRIEARGTGAAQLRSFVHSPRSLREVWSDTRRFGSSDYLIFDDEHVTYDEAHRVTDSVGDWLARRGVGVGDRVAVAMRNDPEWMLIYWACVSAGATIVGLNAWWVADELAAALADCSPKAVFCDEERLQRLERWRADREDDTAIVVVRAEPPAGVIGWSDVVKRCGAPRDVTIDPDSDACIFFTSGTTGRSKGARITHRGCVSNLMNIQFGLQVGERARAQGEAATASSGPPRVLVTTPLFHVTANNGAAHPVASLGGALVLMYKWDAAEALRLIERERITLVVAIPMMLREMLEHPDARKRDLSSLASISGGGAPMPPGFVGSANVPRSAITIGTGFGMTELSGTAAIIAGPALLIRPGSCGRLLPTFEAKIVDEAGDTLTPGGLGELCIRGPGVIPGYLNQPLDYAGPPEQGWMRTGDIAKMDELGYLFLVDRKKDMILRGGENVACAEVEAALLMHPAVDEACVFAVDDDRLGEEVGAAVHLRSGARRDISDLRRHLDGTLARFKTPRYIWIVEQPLARNATGKILRRQIGSSLLKQDADASGFAENGPQHADV